MPVIVSVLPLAAITHVGVYNSEDSYVMSEDENLGSTKDALLRTGVHKRLSKVL